MTPIGLYLHIPFCDGKCAYCNFFSKCADSAALTEYCEHLTESIASWGRKLDRSLDTIYFGGGTPSLLGHARLIKILERIYEAFDVTDDAEITVEVNPSSTDELDFKAMRYAGFNRLSIGLQSADDDELRILGRRHSLSDAERTVSRAQKAGFDNISLDIMLAVPGQTMESLDHSIRFCDSCGVQHISAYILKVEQGTRFYAQRDSLPLFSDDDQAAFYEYAVMSLAQLGYQQYEISNFAKEDFQSRHNLHYWHDDEYLGLGPSAHSFLNDRRFYYDNDFEAFYRDNLTEESTGGDSEEYIMLALRLTEGLNFKAYEERFCHPISDRLITAAIQLQKQGLCTVSDTAVVLTVKGFLVSNSVIAYLLENT